MKKIDLIFGTRPEAIKMIPVAMELRTRPEQFRCRIVVTAQHRKMLDQAMQIFGMTSDIDLDIMSQAQSLTDVTTRTLTRLEDVFRSDCPDLVLVHGDTTTTFAATLAAYYQRIPVGHVEAGLRSHDLNNPWPEELNRRLTDTACQIHFAPTVTARTNLIEEGIDPEKIFVTGNTGIDGLRIAVERTDDCSSLRSISGLNQLLGSAFVLVTAHRRENFGEPIQNLCAAITDICREIPSLHFVYPVHPNPSVSGPVVSNLGGLSNVHLLQPVNYIDFIALMNACWFVLTDSGGVQEEAPSLGKPVLVFRQTTERPEGVDAGTVRIVGTERSSIRHWLRLLATNAGVYSQMQQAINPYGDGFAARRTADAISYFFGATACRPPEFAAATKT